MILFLFTIMIKCFTDYLWCTIVCCASATLVNAQQDMVYFALSLQDPQTHTIHVTMQCRISKQDTVYFKMPQWTPGYYQVMNYANRVSNFAASGKNGQSLFWRKINI